MTVLSLPALAMPDRTAVRVATRRRVLARPATELARLTRYRGGTYSHTVDRIVFSDGSWARTDLIRINPNVHAYSLDFGGVAPEHPSRYRVGSWSALPHLRTRDHEAEVGWIVRNSFPMRPVADLSRRMRAAGYPIGPGDITEHQAIAGTQAAIWHLTNGLTLDTRPLNVPVAVQHSPGPVVTFEFDSEPQLGGYSVSLTSDTAVRCWLEKSSNGVVWQNVSGSQLTAPAGEGNHQRTLGQGSTLSASSHGRGGRGYRHYRLVVAAEAGEPEIGHVGFWLTGTRHYRNADKVVYLYDYLLAEAHRAVHETGPALRAAFLVDSRATAEPELVGPFQVGITLMINAGMGHELVDADGFPVTGRVDPGTDFYLRPAPGTSATTLTATLPGNLHGRVLTGVSLESGAQFTPVALAVPTEMAIEFDISWQTDQTCP